MSDEIKNQDEVVEASAPAANKGVVTPEKDPEKGSLASIDKAGDATKPSKKRKGDKDQGDKSAPKQEEISVEDMTKMEALRSIIETLKGFEKEDIQSLVNEMDMKDKEDDEEEDEDEKSESTKADLLKKIAEHFKSEDEEVVKESLTAILEASEDDDEEEDEDEDEKEVKESKKVAKEDDDEDEDDEDEDEDQEESKKESYDMSDDIEALVSGEDLSEEFQNKAKVVFEAAVSAKVSEIKEELESQKRDEIVEASNEIKDELVEKVDSFLGYVAEEWVKDNELAIERGLKSELTENFITGLKDLFEDHYVEVPSDKLDVVDELAGKVEEVEQRLNEEVSKNIDLTASNEELVKDKVVREVSQDLTEQEVEKLGKLIEDIDFNDEFESNVKTIKESYFDNSAKETVQLDEQVVASEGEESGSTDDKIVDPTMAAYSAAIKRVNPL